MENQPQKPLPNGTAVLVLGIIAIVGCFCDGIPGLVCGIIALVLANKDLRLYNADPTLYTPNSVSNLKSGRTCAIIGLSLSALAVVVLIIYVFTVGWAVVMHPWMLHQSSM
ncbi:MAG TPA: CCC motif membrane protein [Puia sp.]|nr:CCC motif membrane protein [Puia sp.]